MDFQSAMETFAEAWVAANAGQQSQALALTRAANAAAAAAAAVNSAAAAVASKSPTANLNEIVVKKEQLSMHSPTHSTNNNNINNSTITSSSSSSATSAAAAAAATATSLLTTTTTTNAQISSCSSSNDENSAHHGGHSHHHHHHHQQQQQQQQLQQHQHQRRRPSLQGVSEKLTQLQMQHQQQQQQQNQHHHPHHTSDEAHSPRFGGNSSSGAAGRRSNDGSIRGLSPSATSAATATGVDLERGLCGNLSTPTPTPSSSQNPSLSATPKLCERDSNNASALASTSASAANSMVGSITCLPPSALNAVGNTLSGLAVGNAAAMAAQAQQQQNHLHTEKHLTSPSTAAAGSGMASGINLEHAQQQQQQQRRDFDMTKVNSKSLPLHCVVESVHSLQASLTIDMRNPWKRRPNIETDSYVIIAASTPFSEIVQTALQRLGYTQETASTARGSLIIKNWKPIPLEQISDNPVVPVCDIIGELTSVVTLRIVILRNKPSPFGEIKDKLLKLLVLQSHAVLRSTGCPLDELTLSQICRSSYQNSFAFPGGEISDELRRKFDQWWSNQLSPQASMTPKMLPFMTAPAAVPNEMDFPAVAAAAAAAAAAQAGLHVAAGGGSVGVPASINASRESLLLNETSGHHGGSGVPVGSNTPHHHAANMLVHPAMHASMHHHHHHPHSQYPNQKTRMRTSFDPEMELPKLQKWFQENPHPSRQQIQTYVVQLNALDSRRGRKPLDVNNVVYWFKNARAAQKRAEMRGGLGSIGALGHVAMNGYLSQHAQLGQNSSSSTGSMNSGQQLIGGGNSGGNMGNLALAHEYLKSPLSLKSEDIDTMSQHSDDMDEDQSRPGSPQLPLSLTTHERHRNTPDNDDGGDGGGGGGGGGIGGGNNTAGVGDERSDRCGAQMLKNHESESRDAMNGNSNNATEECSRSRNFNHGEDDEKDDMDTDGTSERQQKNERTISTPNQGDNDRITNSPNPQVQTNDNNGNSNQSSSDLHHHIQRQQMLTSTPKLQQHQQQQQQQHISPKEEDDDLDMDEDDDDNENDGGQLDEFRSPSPSDISNAVAAAQRKDLTFPMVPNSVFSQSFMYMSHYMPGFGQAAAAAAAHPHAHHAAAAAAAAGMQQNALMSATGLGSLSSLSSEERRKRNRTFIDPVTEVPKLEHWFSMNTHPSHNLILKYTEDLNQMPYRQKFPRLESKNVQFWFKNRRAKCKRLKMSLYDNSQCSQLAGLNSFVHKYEERD